MGKKLTYEYINYSFFENKILLLETEYINCKVKMKYKCMICNKINSITWSNFQKGHRCPNCAKNKNASNQRHSYDYVYNTFKNKNCELLEKEYINNHTKMKYKCQNGHVEYVCFKSFLKNHGCAKCAGNKIHSFDYIHNFFKKNGCELLETEYINARTKMKYRCKCGTMSEITFDDFRIGQRCYICKIEKLSNKNHYRWNPNREEISLNQRLRIKRKISWIKNNLKSDPNYNNYLNNPNQYHIDHIIPISAFCKYMIENNLEEKEIKRIANDKRNIQILPIQENLQKRDSYDKQILNEYVNKYYKSKRTANI